jgi:hypothetical protein
VTHGAVFTATGAVTIAGTAVCVVALVILHLLPTGLSPLANAVSQYGITPYRLGYRVQTIAMGIAAIAAAIGIAKLDISGRPLMVALFVIFGAARLAISWFPMDTPGTMRTETGRRHGVLALLAFGGATLAALRLGTDLGQAKIWLHARGPLIALGVVMVISLIAMDPVRRNPSTRHYFGAVERLFYLGAIGFLLVVGIELVKTG